MKREHLSTATANISNAMLRKAASGYVIGKARIGYLPIRTHISLGVEAVPDPAVAPHLREAFLMAASGSSVRQVVAWLVRQGVKGNRGGPVSVATVQRMLTDPFYAGFIRDRAGCLAAGRHGALVSRKTFALVQRRLLEKRCCLLKTK